MSNLDKVFKDMYDVNDSADNFAYDKQLTIDWISRTLPFIVYCLGTNVDSIILGFRLFIDDSIRNDYYKFWFKNNIDVIIKRIVELMEKRDPRRKV